jgi:ribose transport system substrate-binding protein
LLVMMWKHGICILALSLAVGCGGGGSGKPAGNGGNGPKKYRIAVIPKGTSHEFWKSVHAGAEMAAKELGNVKVLWKGPLQENDREGQISVVQDFITKRVDGICLAPLDSQALVDYVVEAGEADISVVIFDSGLDGDADNYVTYVATDNYNGGVLAARRLAEVLDNTGDVILLRYNPGSESTEQRERGFLDTIRQEFPELNVLTSDEYAGTSPESSLDKATQVLEKYRDRVDGIFAVCEPNATGVLGALEELELAGKVKFVAFDPNQPLVAGMASGTVDGIVLQDPVKMGYEAVMAMVRHFEGKQVDKRINTGENIATPENMLDRKMAKLLKPEQFED